MRVAHNDGTSPAYGRCDCRLHRAERQRSNRIAGAAAVCLVIAACLWVAALQEWGPDLLRWLGW